eukprot:jgi/Undpi1/4016/HiC_scaffold_16.g07384.m1
MENKTPFKKPWNEAAPEGFQHLEHQLYYDVLGFAPDERRAHNIEKGSGTIWATLGVRWEPQVVPGTIGLVYSDLAEVVSRLSEANRDALEGTAFAWREESDGVVNVSCPYGNFFRLHKRKPDPSAADGQSLAPLDARGGSMPNVSPPAAEGLGIAYVHFRVKPGASAGIARFYQEVFGAEAEEIAVSTSSGETTCSLVRVTRGDETDGGTQASGVVVRVGPVQKLVFVEEPEAPPEYDGHHICVYLTDEGFRRSFLEADKRGLIFTNPPANYGETDTLEITLEEKQFRVKNLVDPATGELLHVLEHEIRCVLHPSYPVGRDVLAKE